MNSVNVFEAIRREPRITRARLLYLCGIAEFETVRVAAFNVIVKTLVKTQSIRQHWDSASSDWRYEVRSA